MRVSLCWRYKYGDASLKEKILLMTDVADMASTETDSTTSSSLSTGTNVRASAGDSVNEGNGTRMQKQSDRTEMTAARRLKAWSSSIPTRWVHALDGLLSALVVTALQRGYLGRGLFSYQLCAVLITLCLLPSMQRHRREIEKITPWKLASCALIWFLFCGCRVCYALLIDLFTGHQKPGMQWYNAVWRIYAIIGLWVCIAYLHLHYIKPFWGKHSHIVFGRFRDQSIPIQTQDLALGQRHKVLMSIRSRVDLLLRRQKRLNENITKCREKIIKLEEEETEQQELIRVRDRLVDLESDLEDVQDQLKLAQHDWTKALPIEKYRGFYR